MGGGIGISDLPGGGGGNGCLRRCDRLAPERIPKVGLERQYLDAKSSMNHWYPLVGVDTIKDTPWYCEDC